jgi:Methane/Phenol/Toluene Hydroxylase
LSRQSVAKAHQKIQELAWEPQYHEPVAHYGTDYTFQKAAKKDPLKQVLRSYFPMQEEKDHRVYGAQDGAIRGNMFRQVQERWLEWQKLFLSIIPLPEISAARRSYSANRTPTSGTCSARSGRRGGAGPGAARGAPRERVRGAARASC